MNFQPFSYVEHKDQDIEGIILSSNEKESTIYNPDCPNDCDFESESYGPGSALTFKNYQLKKIDKPSKRLIELCKCVFD